MDYKDYYKIMGLERTASADDIKRAYRKLARKYHPDVSKEANAEAKFKELGEAYDVLKDPEKRSTYDQLGANWQQAQASRPPPNYHQQQRASSFDESGGDSDFFESLFGRMGGRPHRQQPYAVPGEDYHGKLQITLEDAFNGATRDIQLPIVAIDADGQQHVQQRKLKVKIPAGVTSGQTIRLSGQGAPGQAGGKQGDLYLDIDVLPDPRFDVDGRDVYLTLPIAPWEAALGGKISVPTLAGKVDLTIPAGSQGGNKLRLKGRGMPGSPAGDQYVLLKILIPHPITAEAKALYEKMAHDLPFNPRATIGM